MIHKIVLFVAGVVLDFMGFLELTSPALNAIAPSWEWGVIFLFVGIVLNLAGVFL